MQKGNHNFKVTFCFLLMFTCMALPLLLWGNGQKRLFCHQSFAPTVGPLGSWQTGLKYQPTCKLNHTHGCCLPNRTRGLYFRFSDVHLNQYKILNSFTRKFKNKNVLIMGDSQQRALFDGLCEVYAVQVTITNKANFVKQNVPQANWFQARLSTGGWLHYLYFYYPNDKVKACSKYRGGKFVANKAMIETVLKRNHIIIVNLGLHYHFCGLNVIYENIHFLCKLLSAQKVTQQVIFRSTLPQHFHSHLNTGFFRNPTNTSCTSSSPKFQHPTNPMVRDTVIKYGFKYLDNFDIYKDRYNLHTTPGDCTHYCFTPELLMPELVLLDQLLV